MSWDLKTEKLPWRKLGLRRRVRACDGWRQEGSRAEMERKVVLGEVERGQTTQGLIQTLSRVLVVIPRAIGRI